MHDLAKLAMRGPRQAILLACVSMLIPMMFWFGAAIVSLTTLRKGFSQGLNVYIWAAIPGLGWWFGMQDPGSFIVLTTALIMSVVLRVTISWQSTLAAGAVISILVGSFASQIMPELIEMLMSMTDQFFQKLAEESQQEYDEATQGVFRSLMIASFAASFYGMATGSLFLARSWQSKLFNPGGWRSEFHSLKLSPKATLIMVVVMMFAPNIGFDPALVLMVITVPLLICGFALVHALIARKNMGGHWLFLIYVSAIVLFPTVFVLIAMLALVDGVIDFRGRGRTE